jgi:hypothetical protein
MEEVTDSDEHSSLFRYPKFFALQVLGKQRNLSYTLREKGKTRGSLTPFSNCYHFKQIKASAVNILQL